MEREQLLTLAKEWIVPMVVGLFLLAVFLPDPQAVDTSRPYSEWVKIWLAAAGVVLIVAWKVLPRGIGQRLLLALTLCASINYARYSPAVPMETVDSYDLIHYYLAAKYFDDLGYYDLYPAALLADAEAGPYNRKATFYRAQDAERGYRERVPIPEGVEHGKVVKERMGDERWEAFKHDFITLQRKHRLGQKMWHTLINDRGFNGTPVWLLIGGPIAKVFPVEWIKVLCYLDFFLLALGLLALGWAFGWVTPLWALFFLLVTYSLRWPYVTWAFMRYDWVAALMVAMALLKKSRFGTAGALAAYAGLVRLFPLAWMFGPFMKGVGSLLKPGKPLAERADRRMLKMGVAFAITLSILEGGAVGCFGLDAIKTHAGNIAEHIKPEELSSRRIGFALAYTYDGRSKPKLISAKKKAEIKATRVERYGLAGVLLLSLGWALRRRRPEEAFAIGFIPFFMLTTASYYYLVCRITLIAWHASDLSRLRNRIGLAWLFGLEFLANYAETYATGYRYLLIGHLAWGVLIYCIGMTMMLTWETDRGLDVEEEPADERPIVDGEPDWRGIGIELPEGAVSKDGASAAAPALDHSAGDSDEGPVTAKAPPATKKTGPSGGQAKPKGKAKGKAKGKGKKKKG